MAYGLITSSGCEATNNDRTLKIILVRNEFVDYENNASTTIYDTHMFSKTENNTWEDMSVDCVNYTSIQQFISQLSKISIFSRAYHELTQP